MAPGARDRPLTGLTAGPIASVEPPALGLAEVRRLVTDGVPRAVGLFRADTPGPTEVDYAVDPAHALAEVVHHPVWVVVADVERAPEMLALRDAAVDAVRPRIEAADGPIDRIAIALLVSGPQAPVAVHVNEYHDLTVQTAGTRIFRVARFDDPVVTNRLVEAAHAGATVAAPDPPAADAHVLGPADGLFVPAETPHWLDPGDDVAVQVTVTAWTTTGRRRADTHRLNHRLRRIGLRPAPVGAHPRVDAAKAAAWRTGRRIVRR